MSGRPAPEVDEDYGRSREVLHRIATHVLARRRFAVCGRFGLRASPGGFTTPAFGEGPEVIRVAGDCVVREVGNVSTRVPIEGSTLRELATMAGTDIDAPFGVGEDTPAVSDPDRALELAPAHAHTIAQWYAFGWQVLDQTIAALPAAAEPATIQLWPEHFDVGTGVAVADSGRVNLGFSPGDTYEAAPYLYVGPWAFEPALASDFFNAPFGAVRRAADVLASKDPVGAALEFISTGLRLVGARDQIGTTGRHE